MRLRWAFAVGLAATVLTVPDAALAAYPGANGKIAFERGGQIWTMNADGTGQAQVTTAAEPSSDPEWSPDGSEMVYVRGTGDERTIRIMNADGSGDEHFSYGASSPSWLADGSLAVNVYRYFGPPQFCNCWVWEMRAHDRDHTRSDFMGFGRESATGDRGPVENIEWTSTSALMWTNGTEGVDRQVVVDGVVFAGEPNVTEAFGAGMSPDGTKIAWVQKDIGAAVATLYTRDRSGGTPQPAGDVGDKVEWSPDGAKLVFDRGGDLYTSNPDGTARLQLTSTPQAERNADWQPVPTTTYPGYARPKEAALLDVSLVPTYVPCALRPNRTHGPPLAYSSCNPPRLFSRYLTMGTPDANGLPAETSGNLRLTVRAGDLATQANEADVRIRFSVNGVRCQYNFFSTACRNANGSPGGLLYDGGLDLELKFQLTDRFNLPSERGRGPGTTGKLLLEFGPYCDLGTCAQNTSVNALMGPVAREGRRAVWELDAIMVRDEQYPRGPLRSFFLTQGVFVP